MHVCLCMSACVLMYVCVHVSVYVCVGVSEGCVCMCLCICACVYLWHAKYKICIFGIHACHKKRSKCESGTTSVSMCVDLSVCICIVCVHLSLCICILCVVYQI